MMDKVKKIIQAEVAIINSVKHPLGDIVVIGARPGDSISVPNMQFSNGGSNVAGMEVTVNALHYIVLNEKMKTESILSTFFHELGHAKYRREMHTNETQWDSIDSEAYAIKSSLESLKISGFLKVAKDEVKSIMETAASDKHYSDAVDKIKDSEIWKEFS